MKKTLAILLALIMVLTLVGCNAAAAGNTASDKQNGVLQGDSQKNNPDTQNDVSADTGKTQTSDTQNNISADTGKTQTSNTQAGDPADISRDEAINIALKHAGVAKKDAKGLTAEKDLDDRPVHYDVDFNAGGYEYDYEIEAATGKILKSQKEKDDDAKQSSAASSSSASSSASSSSTSSSASSGVTKTSAKKTALEHAKVAEKNAKRLKVERDDDGYYEVSFYAGGYEYDYKISAKTGKILKWEKERDKDAQQTTPSSTVSKADAKATALKHAGVSSTKARDLEVELDDGYYEVTFEAGGYEYDYKISAKTGKITHSEKERND